MIQMSVKAKDLAEARLAVSEKRFGETRLFPDPVMAGKSRQRSA